VFGVINAAHARTHGSNKYLTAKRLTRDGI